MTDPFAVPSLSVSASSVLPSAPAILLHVAGPSTAVVPIALAQDGKPSFGSDTASFYQW